MRLPVRILLALFVLVPYGAVAQSELEDRLLSSLDESLFLGALSLSDDPYYEATKYYHTPVEFRRRGLDWWVLRDADSRFLPEESDFITPQKSTSVRASAATRNYQYAISIETGRLLGRGWSLYGEVDYRAGRDCSIEGVFSQDMRPQITLQKEFSEVSHLSLSVDLPYTMQGLRSSATSESFTLTGDNLYNPSWGLYQGEVRNSRVSKNSISQLDICYDTKVGRDSKLMVNLQGDYGRRSVSRLGWYDAYNPTPDYYRKVPSYLADGDVKSQVEELWRSGDEEYTQIAWDKLVVMNQQSEDGAAYYIIEDQVTREMDFELTALFSQRFSSAILLRYGVVGGVTSNRLFKEVDDLLGAEYHLDIDQFIGDYASLGNDLQNDLRNPDREVVEGDRFGYDYTRHSTTLEALLGVEYRVGALSMALDGRFGDVRQWREGHYERERFAGEGAAGSYGLSNVVDSSSSSVDLKCQYSFASQHKLSLHMAMCRMPQDHQDLFLDEQSANRLVDQLDPRRLGMVCLGYNFISKGLRLSVEGYYQELNNVNDVWSGYDDLSYTYADVVVSGISTRSVGVEAVASYRVSSLLTFDMSLSIGDYTYNSTPLVQLYDNATMDLISESQAVAIEGCKVGNAPQYVANCGVNIYPMYGLMLSLDCSYAAGRYVAPSFSRRSERVLRGAGSDELVAELIEQRSLAPALDLRASVMRTLQLRGGRSVAIYLRVENLLGDRDGVSYGRESSRILRGEEFSTTYSYYAEADEYLYTTPRTLYLSCSYRW